jgi:hypothetical protein
MRFLALLLILFSYAVFADNCNSNFDEVLHDYRLLKAKLGLSKTPFEKHNNIKKFNKRIEKTLRKNGIDYFVQKIDGIKTFFVLPEGEKSQLNKTAKYIFDHYDNYIAISPVNNFLFGVQAQFDPGLGIIYLPLTYADITSSKLSSISAHEVIHSLIDFQLDEVTLKTPLAFTFETLKTNTHLLEDIGDIKEVNYFKEKFFNGDEVLAHAYEMLIHLKSYDGSREWIEDFIHAIDNEFLPVYEGSKRIVEWTMNRINKDYTKISYLDEMQEIKIEVKDDYNFHLPFAGELSFEGEIDPSILYPISAFGPYEAAIKEQVISKLLHHQNIMKDLIAVTNMIKNGLENKNVDMSEIVRLNKILNNEMTNGGEEPLPDFLSERLFTQSNL